MTFGAGAPAPAAAARRRGPASSPCAARWPRASRPTASHEPHALAARAAAASARSRASPGFVVVISDFRDQHAAGRAPLGALRARHSVLAVEVARPARGASCPPSAAWRWSTPRRASGSRSTPRARACASASPRSSASAASGVARELRRLHVEHVALSTDGDWLLRAGAEAAVSFATPAWLLGAGCSCRWRCSPTSASRRRAQPLRGALHRRARAEGRRRHGARLAPPPAGGAGCWPRWPRSCWRWPSRSGRSRCRSSARRSCS